jgi:hypothetical protein
MKWAALAAGLGIGIGALVFASDTRADGEGYMIPYTGNLRYFAGPNPWTDGQVDDFFGGTVAQGWQLVKDQACTEIARQVGAVLEDEVGQHLYEPWCDFPEGALGVKLTGSILALKFAATHVTFGFRTTQPTPAGNWADPRFTTTFDAALFGTIHLPETLPGAAITIDELQVFVDNAQIAGNNVVGVVEAFATQVMSVLYPARLAVMHAGGLRVGLPQLQAPLDAALDGLAAFLRKWGAAGWQRVAYEADANGDFILYMN